MDPKLTPRGPQSQRSTARVDSEFDKESRSFRVLISQSVLYPTSYLARGLAATSFERNQLFPV